jgi:hypothetical protein
MPAVVALSTFRTQPKQGHLDRAKRVIGYLKANPDGAVRFRVDIPRHEDIHKHTDMDWTYSVYGKVKEEEPKNMPTPLGKPVRLTAFVDANLMHDMVTGRSLTGLLLFVNQTPVEWYSKKQATVETATFGSEFIAARISTEHIMDIRYTLRMLGVPLDGPAWMFGDNEGVNKNCTIPHSMLKKRHNARAYHRVREAIAAKILYFIDINGKKNPADPLTKFLCWNDIKDKVGPVLFWKGDTLTPPVKTRGVTETKL